MQEQVGRDPRGPERGDAGRGCSERLGQALVRDALRPVAPGLARLPGAARTRSALSRQRPSTAQDRLVRSVGWPPQRPKRKRLGFLDFVELKGRVASLVRTAPLELAGPSRDGSTSVRRHHAVSPTPSLLLPLAAGRQPAHVQDLVEDVHLQGKYAGARTLFAWRNLGPQLQGQSSDLVESHCGRTSIPTSILAPTPRWSPAPRSGSKAGRATRATPSATA